MWLGGRVEFVAPPEREVCALGWAVLLQVLREYCAEPLGSRPFLLLNPDQKVALKLQSPKDAQYADPFDDHRTVCGETGFEDTSKLSVSIAEILSEECIGFDSGHSELPGQVARQSGFTCGVNSIDGD